MAITLTEIKVAAIAILLLILIAAGFLLHHRGYESGMAVIKAQDAIALGKAEARAAATEALMQKQIEDASHANDQEISDLRAFRAANPVQPIRVCHDTSSGRTVSNAATAALISQQLHPAATGVQPVPARDPGATGENIALLLDALAGRADQLSAQCRAIVGATSNVTLH